MKWLMRMLRLSDPDPVERVDEAAQARAEAAHRRKATEEVLRVREHIIIINHIAYDIGRAYSLTTGKAPR